MVCFFEGRGLASLALDVSDRFFVVSPAVGFGARVWLFTGPDGSALKNSGAITSRFGRVLSARSICSSCRLRLSGINPQVCSATRVGRTQSSVRDVNHASQAQHKRGPAPRLSVPQTRVGTGFTDRLSQYIFIAAEVPCRREVQSWAGRCLCSPSQLRLSLTAAMRCSRPVTRCDAQHGGDIQCDSRWRRMKSLSASPSE